MKSRTISSGKRGNETVLRMPNYRLPVNSRRDVLQWPKNEPQARLALFQVLGSGLMWGTAPGMASNNTPQANCIMKGGWKSEHASSRKCVFRVVSRSKI